MAKYEVGIKYRGLNHYLVEANDEEEAEQIAQERYEDGDNGETLGNEYEDIDDIYASKVDNA